MAIHSYKIELTTDVVITLNTADFRTADLWDAIILKAKEQLEELDMNRRKYRLKVGGQIVEDDFALPSSASSEQ